RGVCSMSSRWIRMLALGASALAASCSHESLCEDHQRAKESRELAKIAYDGGHFDQAKDLYALATEKCSDHYDARIGLANASRALGNLLYQQADQNAQAGKLQPAQ